jgi:hypothetical protein
MTDAPAAISAAGHNLPPIAQIGEEMTHHAQLWATNVEKGGKHENQIKVLAYRLREYMEDGELCLAVKGLLRDADVPTTKRSSAFTQLLRLAFHKAKVQPEPSQLSRWAWALQHAWNQDPHPAPDEVLKFIKDEGGDVECRNKARAANRDDGDRTEPEPIPLYDCSLPDDLDGKRVRVEKTEKGWQLIPPKVPSGDRTTTPPSPAA